MCYDATASLRLGILCGPVVINMLQSPFAMPSFVARPTLAPLQNNAVHLSAVDDPPLPRKLRRIVGALRNAPDTRERSLRLVRLGDRLPLAPIGDLGPHTRVPGCISVVHLHAQTDADGMLQLSGAADSRLARGLVSLLVRGLRGEPADAARRLDVRAVAEAAGLPALLTPGRLNGMEAMLRVLTTQLDELEQQQQQQPAQEEAAAPSTVDGVPSAASSAADAARPTADPAAHPRLLWPAAEEEVALLLSGGVDSSVALHRLLEAGHRVRAFYLRIWLEDEQAHAARGACPWEEDWEYCEAVCRQAGVPLESVSLQDEYQQHVVGYLVDEAAAGRTPNPDIMCNSRIKFGVFHDRIGRHFKHVASGHYARVAPAPSEDRVQLLTSADAHKDQTYFLSQLTQDQLRKAIFPVGDLPKPDVRAAAQRLQLPNRDRKDSQGICFLGQLNYDDFLRDHLGERPGTIVEHESGVEIGTHRGLWFHTVGQRRGLGPVLNNANRAKGPWHVVHKDFDENVLYATRHYSGEDKARNEFSAAAINWVAGAPPAGGDVEVDLRVKVRHGEHTHAAHVTLSDGGSHAKVRLAERDKGLAPGQFAAFYDGEVCLGSGAITEGAI